MADHSWPADHFHRFEPPYLKLSPLARVSDVAIADGVSGTILVWCMGRRYLEHVAEVALRTPGVALVMVIPPSKWRPSDGDLLGAIGDARPTAVLPFHGQPSARDLQVLLRHAPDDLPGQLIDFLSWRGLDMTSEGRQLFRRTVDLATHLRSVSGLARALHISRRALARRFAEENLPVPSHCLQFSRILHGHILSQRPGEHLTAVASTLGYPDAFSMSNQMMRIVGVRPSEARSRLGWEWLLELWLRNEGIKERRGVVDTCRSRPNKSSPYEGEGISPTLLP
jgi:AraC-like DNA-binding protein